MGRNTNKAGSLIVLLILGALALAGCIDSGEQNTVVNENKQAETPQETQQKDLRPELEDTGRIVVVASRAPEQVMSGESFVMNVTLVNTALAAREVTLRVEVDGTVAAAQIVRMEALTTKEVPVTLSIVNRGTRGVNAIVVDRGEISSTETSVEVAARANLVIAKFEAEPKTIVHDEQYYVGLTIKNEGDLTGDGVIRILANGAEIASRSIAVSGGATQGHGFTFGFPSPGRYTISAEISGKGAPTTSLVKVRHEYRVYIEPLPSYLPAEMHGGYLDAVKKGILSWGETDERAIKVVTNSGQRNVLAQFVKEWGGHKGGQAYRDMIQIGVGDSQCEGMWTPYHRKTVEKIAAHEMGHILGLPHSSDPNDVMSPAFPYFYGTSCQRLTIDNHRLKAEASQAWWIQRDRETILEYSFQDVDSGQFILCVERPGMTATCHTKTGKLSQSITIPAGKTTITVTCKNWYEDCILKGAVAVRETF